MFEAVRGGRLDAAVGVWPSGTGSPAGLNARPIAADRLEVVAARGTVAPGPTPVAALGRRPWVLNPDGCGFRASLTSAMTRAGETLEVAVETPRIELQLELVARGLGVGLVPRWALMRSPHRDALQTVAVTDLGLDIRYLVVDAGVPQPFVPVLDLLRDGFAAAMGFAADAAPVSGGSR